MANQASAWSHISVVTVWAADGSANILTLAGTPWAAYSSWAASNASFTPSNGQRGSFAPFLRCHQGMPSPAERCFKTKLEREVEQKSGEKTNEMTVLFQGLGFCISTHTHNKNKNNNHNNKIIEDRNPTTLAESLKQEKEEEEEVGSPT